MRTRAAVYSLVASTAAFGLTILPGPWLPRFAFDPLNYWFTAVSALAVPLTIALIGFNVADLKSRIAVFTVAVATAVPMVPLGLFSLLEAANTKNGEHLSLMLLSEASSRDGKYRLYRTDCGATCAYGLELRKEIDVLGVAKLVAPVWSASREEVATLRVTSEGRVQVVRGNYVIYTVGNDA